MRWKLSLLGMALASAILVSAGAPASTSITEATGQDIFGNGADGAKTYSVNTTDAPIDSPTSGTVGASTLSATNGAFAAGQKILLHQSRGSGAGGWEINEIQSYSSGTITTVSPLANTYTSSGASAAQVLVIPQYTNLTVEAGVTVIAKAWDGSTGGIFAAFVNGTANVVGTISARGMGYRGGGAGVSLDSFQGEGTPGVGTQRGATGPNGNGGGGANGSMSAGGGGGNGSPGSPGSVNGEPLSAGGLAAGSPDLNNAVFGGGGGGSCGSQYECGGGRDGGGGGGIVFLFAATATMGMQGEISADGHEGNGEGEHGSGGGAGGSILIRTEAATLGIGLIHATGGAGGLDHGCTCCDSEDGGGGGVGRIRLEYCAFSGSTIPPASRDRDGSCAVGGIAEYPQLGPRAASSGRGSSAPSAAALAGVVAGGALLLAAGAWYAGRRRRAG
jgi:hypothetical protein